MTFKPYSDAEKRRIEGRYKNIQITMLWLGVIVLLSQILLGAFSNAGFPPSISHSYHTALGDLIFGSLFAVGFFLISYQSPVLDTSKIPIPILVGTLELPTGYNFWISTVAGLGAIGVAIFPVDPVISPTCISQIDQAVSTNCVNGLTEHGVLLGFENGWHFLSALLFFLGTAFLCIFVFPAEFF